ncbi:ATP-binding protein [Wenyingzhuangia sp. IMCC45533]
MKQLNLKKNSKDILNFCHYYRGSSFLQKRIIKEAKREFLLVHDTFELMDYLYFSLGLCELELNNTKKAIEYFKESERIQLENNTNIVGTQNNIGIAYLRLKNYKQAEIYYLKNLEILQFSAKKQSIARAFGNIASLYYEQYMDDKAIIYFNKAYELAKETDDYGLKQSIARNLAVVEENRKNFEKSLAYRKEHEQWKDSLNDQNKIWQVAKLEKEFAVKQKQKEVKILQAENEVKEAQKRGFIYSSLILFLLLIASVYFFYEKVKTNRIITAQKENLNELNATKDRLFSIVSHDLRSSVNALKSSNSKLVSNLQNNNLNELDVLLHNNTAIVNGAYSLLDNLLHWALLQTKQSYFDIQTLRLFVITEQIAYNYTAIMVDKGIDFEFGVLKKDKVLADQESLKIVLRNLIDNAIKFTNPGGIIKIYTQQNQPNYCDLVVEDSGQGMDEKTRLELMVDDGNLSKTKNEELSGTGLGLQLCKSMIKKNKGKFSIESELGKGTKMIVSLIKA